MRTLFFFTRILIKTYHDFFINKNKSALKIHTLKVRVSLKEKIS